MADRVTLNYDVYSMPTAQHKAGLAGMIMSIQEMQRPERSRGEDAIPADEIPEIDELTSGAAKITLTEKSCQRLFDECYKARPGVAKVKSKWQGAKLLKTEEVEIVENGKSKKVTYYFYDVLEPNNPMLAQHWFRPDADSQPDLYAKLWRDMLFQVPRAKPTTRNPYKETAAGEPCKEGSKMWAELQRFEKDRLNNKLRVSKLSSALLLGAQELTAENLGFLERSDYLLALNFWPLATMIYVPCLLDIDPANPKNSRAEPSGYSLVFPDIQDLKKFCSRFPKTLADLRNENQPQGYRPRALCIDIPAEGAIDLLSRQAEIVSAKEVGKRVNPTLHAAEFLHVAKFGNNVKSLASGRFSADPLLLEKYQTIRNRYRSPLFRSIRLKSLFGSPSDSSVKQHWWEAFEKPLSTFPHELFIGAPRGALPSIAWAWCRDVRRAFDEEEHFSLFNFQESEMSTETTDTNPNGAASSVKNPKTIEQLVKQMVQNHVRITTEKKSGVEFKQIKAEIAKQTAADQTGAEVKNSKDKNAFEDRRRKIAATLFLEFRSRHAEDFKAYFAEVFGRHPQWALKNDDSFQRVCDCLLKKPEEVRTITLLALSSAS